MKRYPFLYLLFLGFLLAACGNEKNSETLEITEEDSNQVVLSKAQFETNGFTLDTLRERPFPEWIEVSGMIDVPPQNKAVITATVGGFVKRTPLLIGDVVKQGQPLLTLENPEYVKMQQEYLEVYRRLDFLKSEYDRQKTLYDEKITSQKNYLKAQSDYETALATYNGLKKQLQMLNISTSRVEQQQFTSEVTLYAHISGSVTKMNVSKGSFVSPATEIMQIVDNEHIHLELTVFEKDILKVKKGQEILFSIPEASDEAYRAEVHLVGTSIEESNRSIRVHGHLVDEENHGFLTGMFVEAKIVATSSMEPSLQEYSVVLVEDEAVALRLVHQTETEYVFEKVYPKLKMTKDGYAALGLKLGAETMLFLGKGAFNLLAEE